MTQHTKQKRQFWVILLIVFLGFLGISMPYLIFPSLFLNPNYSFLPADWSNASRALFLGMTLAAYPLGQFIGSPVLGSLSDDYGRKRLLSGSLCIAALSNLITGLAIAYQQLGLLLFSRFIAGFMEGNIAIARAMVADLTTISKHTSFGKMNAAMSIAFLIGPLLGGSLTDTELFPYVTTSTPFYLTCLLFLALTLLSAVILEPTPKSAPTNVQTLWQRMNLVQRLSRLFMNKRLRFLLLISTCFTLAVDIFYEFGPVYLTVKWGLAPSGLVLYNGVLCLALATGNGWLASVVASRVSTRLAITCSIGALALFLIGIVLTNSTTIMLLLFTLTGIAIVLAVSLLTAKISNTESDTVQGEVMGTQIALRVLGDALICLFGGALLLVSPKLILVVAALMSLSAMITYARFAPKMKAL